MSQDVYKDKKREKRVLLFTILIGIAICISLFYPAFMIPDPPLADKAFAVDFGEDVKIDNSKVNSGGSSKSSAKKEEVVEEEEVQETETIEEPANVETQKQESVNESVKNPDPPKEKPPTPTPVQKPKSLYGGSSGSSSSSSENGSGDGDGDTDNGGEGNGTSNGFGNGAVSGKLGNRGVVKYPGEQDHNCGAQGKVVLDITVDKYGKITRTKINPSKTKTSNTCLHNRAKELASQMRFQKGSKIYEDGYVVFNFTVN